MSQPTLLAIDQGTTSSRAILFSKEGLILKTAQKDLEQYYPHKGWVEQDAEDIWTDTLWACREVLKIPEAKKCAVIGITNQRETVIIWDRKTGIPVYNAIVWQDRRTAAFTNKLNQRQGVAEQVTSKTGLLVDPYFSCSKVSWILDNVDGVRARADRGELAFGTVDCFLLWRLTNGKVHTTDATNASRTGLFNIVTQDWDDELLKLYDVPRSLLPEVKDNIAHFGDSDPALFGGVSFPIGGIAGDQHAALVGQCCFEKGMMKSTYGTGCFALMNIGAEFKTSENRLLTTPAYRINGQTTYAIEGSIFMAGATVQWLRDNLKVISKASESEELAMSVSNNNGVYFIPAFTGLGAPYWLPEARAMIAGLTRESTAAHITRAALEAQAYQTMDLLRAMEADTDIFPETLRCDGGLVANQFVCKFLADILQTTIEIPKVTETTALGAAYLAGLYAGVYKDLDDLSSYWGQAQLYKPSMKTADAKSLYGEWLENLECFLRG